MPAPVPGPLQPPAIVEDVATRLLPILAPALAACLFSACSTSSKTPSSPSPVPPANTTINYTAIGASDAQAIGASVECIIPFADCPNGTGYVQVAARLLKAKGFAVNLTNLGIGTATVGRDFQDLGNNNGHLVVANFVESEAPVVNANATLITIFGGGNDVNVVTGALGRGAGAGDQVGYINAQVKAFGVDYAALLNLLRARAPSARLVALNLPNMGALPFLAGASANQRLAAQLLSVGMTTTVINPLAAQGVLVIDMMCDSRSYDAATYSSDGFHPSDTGYAWMAAEVVSAATTSYKSPQGACSSMTLVPQ
jgi:lysophospholipase L1-like esterase